MGGCQYNVTNLNCGGYFLDKYYSTYKELKIETIIDEDFVDHYLSCSKMEYIKPSVVVKYLVKDVKHKTKQDKMAMGFVKTFAIAQKGLDQVTDEDIKSLANNIQKCKKNELGRWFALGSPFNVISKISSIAATCFLFLGCLSSAFTLASLIFPVPAPVAALGLISLAICLPARVCFRLLSVVTGKIGNMLLNWNVNSKIRNQDQSSLLLEDNKENKDIDILNSIKDFDHDAFVVRLVLKDIQVWLSNAKLKDTTLEEKIDFNLFKEYVSKLQRNLDDQFSRRDFIKQAYMVKA
jgi:hypothetical protein